METEGVIKWKQRRNVPVLFTKDHMVKPLTLASGFSPPPIRANSISFFTKLTNLLNAGDIKGFLSLLKDPINVRNDFGKWIRTRISHIRFSYPQFWVDAIESQLTAVLQAYKGTRTLVEVAVPGLYRTFRSSFIALSPKFIHLGVDPIEIEFHYHRFDVEGFFTVDGLFVFLSDSCRIVKRV
jgi:hypothetical protein